MHLKNISALKILGTAVILTFTVISCNNNDTTESSATTTTDTATIAPPVMTDTAMTTTAPAVADNTAANKPGTAKPNPAKKGMKGKVSVVVPTKSTSPEAKMEADASGIYANTEILPSFPGGNKGLQKFFDNNLEYPVEAGNDGVEGTVNVTFVVDENGKVSSPKVMGDNLGYGLEAEALRVVNKMPTWNPGKLKGQNVKTRFTLPIRFVLE